MRLNYQQVDFLCFSQYHHHRFLLTFYFLFYWVYHYLNISADTHMWRILIGLIPILLLCFGIYITYYTIKNRGVRETDPKNLYKDNKRIPFAVTIQILSILLYPVLVYYATLQSNSALLQILDFVPVLMIYHCLVISFFYMDDIFYGYIREQDSEGHVKPIIKVGLSFSILAVITFISCYLSDYSFGSKIAIYVGIALFILLAFCIILLTICVFLN